MELNEFRDTFWQETARWLGYEENLNLTTGQWGASHVSYLTFKSLLQLRRTMSTGDLGEKKQSAGERWIRCMVRAAPLRCPAGAIIFDLNASSLSTVADKVADELLNKDQIRPSDYDSLKRALVMRRR